LLGQLSALQTLNLSWCHALTSLPASLGQLSALHIICRLGRAFGEPHTSIR
jgi:hypothetical protein